jgi:hypothetical protein
MPLVPELRVPRIEFYETHLPPWMENAEALGLSETTVNLLAARTAAARAAFLAQQEALAAARAATLAFHVAVAEMHAVGAEAIRTIRNTAESAGGATEPRSHAGTKGSAGGPAISGSDIYVLSQIPPPAAPASAPPPGTPTEFKTTLLPGGAVELRWRCANPRGTNGTVYEVRRRIGNAADAALSGGRDGFEYLGLSGTRRFSDTTLPAGAGMVVYQVTAVRSTRRGAAARFIINLGVGGGAALRAEHTAA